MGVVETLDELGRLDNEVEATPEVDVVLLGCDVVPGVLVTDVDELRPEFNAVVDDPTVWLSCGVVVEVLDRC